MSDEITKLEAINEKGLALVEKTKIPDNQNLCITTHLIYGDPSQPILYTGEGKMANRNRKGNKFVGVSGVLSFPRLKASGVVAMVVTDVTFTEPAKVVREEGKKPVFHYAPDPISKPEFIKDFQAYADSIFPIAGPDKLKPAIDKPKAKPTAKKD